jgi:ribonuclease HI
VSPERLSPSALKVLREVASGRQSGEGEGDFGVEVYCDGASRGNPGPAGAGALLLKEGGGEVLARVCKALGRATNNEAEYAALLLGLTEARRRNATRVSVFADSELVIKQLTGVYRVKHPVMRERHQEAMRLLAQFKTWRATHVPRERNAEADRLANQALDAPGGMS